MNSMIEWGKPQIVIGFGSVCVSKCKRFFIDKRNGESGVRLCTNQNHRGEVFKKIQEAKLAANEMEKNGLVPIL